MIKHAYKKCNYDCYVYYKRINEGMILYLLLYLDNMLITCHDILEIDYLKSLLRSESKLKDLRAAKKIFRMEIIRNKKIKAMFLTQENYIKRILLRLDMYDSKPI